MSVARELRKLNEMRDAGASEAEKARKKILKAEGKKSLAGPRKRRKVYADPKPFKRAPLIDDKPMRYAGIGIFVIAGLCFLFFIESWALSIGLIFLLLIAGIALFSERFW